MAARSKKIKVRKVKFVNWLKCKYCREPFWWWLMPFRAGGKHKNDCPVKLGKKKPKFYTVRLPLKGKKKVGKRTN